MLFWDASDKQVKAMNGSGRAGRRCTLGAVRRGLGVPDEKSNARIPLASAHSVTVPGAAAGWVDAVERFGSGRVDLRRILAPAIELGEGGFPVSEVAAHAVCFVPSISPHRGLSRVSSWMEQHVERRIDTGLTLETT